MTNTVKIKGIPLKAFEEMTIGEIRKLDKQFREHLKGNGKKSKR